MTINTQHPVHVLLICLVLYIVWILGWLLGRQQIETRNGAKGKVSDAVLGLFHIVMIVTWTAYTLSGLIGTIRMALRVGLVAGLSCTGALAEPATICPPFGNSRAMVKWLPELPVPAPSLVVSEIKDPKADLVHLNVDGVTKFRVDHAFRISLADAWLVIRQPDREDLDPYSPAHTELDSAYEPVVRKVGNRWIIKFKTP